MTKTKAKRMASSNNNNSSLPDMGDPTDSLTPGSDMLPSRLKPKLDLIFSEVEKKLPDIDFDLSDVDSDSEEPVMFHQHLKSLEEDKDLDTSSQGSDSLTELSAFNENKEVKSSLNSFTFYDNDLAYELQRTSIPAPVSSWGEIPIPSEKDKNKIEKGVSSWSDIPTGKSETFTDITKVDTDVQTMDTDTDLADTDPDLGALANNEKTGDNRFVNEQLSLNSLDDKLIKKQLNREASRNKEKDLATSLVSPRAPVLSMQILDNIDLDNLLENFNSDNQTAPPAPRRAWSEQTRSETTNIPNVGKNAAQGDGSSAMTLIQKLAQMSMSQYGEDLSDVDPTTGARKKDKNNRRSGDDMSDDDVDNESKVINKGHGLEKYEEEKISEKCRPKEEPKKKKKQTTSSGMSTDNNNEPLRVITPRVRPQIPPPPVKQTDEASALPGGKGDKDPTVFIDLRNFEQIRQEQQHNIERVQKVLGIQPEKSVYDNGSDSDEDTDEWQKQRQKIKQQISTSGSKPSKRSFSASDKPPVHHRQQPRVINMSDRPARESQSMVNSSSVTASPEDRELQRQRLQEAKEKERQMEIVRKLREKQESERQAKLRLQKRLDALQPSASISGRQGPAETTPTVFDMDASYEPAPRSLPPVMSPDTDSVLLTIHLSANGEIVLHRGSGNKSVDTGSGLSASYTTLLTWLLTLVPNNFSYLQNDGNKVQSPWMLPFYVVGLQQVLMDGQLCLMVAVTPVEQFDAKYMPTKSRKNKKSDVKNSTAFQQHLQKLFSTNTLHSVCPWLQNMVSMELGPGGDDAGDQDASYIYKPPLPNITTKPLSTFIHVNPDPKAAEKVFNSSVGFFWQTVDSEEGRLDQDLHDESMSYDTQNTLSLIYKKIYQEPSAMMGILNRVLQLGLDLAGVRLVYPSPEQMNIPQTDNASMLSEMDLLNNVGAVLCLCIRGSIARSLWLDAVGPSDPVLARRTDPNSLCALYGGDSRDECLLFCPRNAARVQTELARWFGGRVPPGNVIDVGTPYTKKESLRSGSPKGRRGKKVTFSDTKDTSDSKRGSIEDVHRPLATLTATTKSEIMLVMSPLVPPKCFGIILASCQRRGFQVTGIRRTRLSSKRAAALGITGDGLKAFCPGSTVDSYDASLADHVDPKGYGQWRESIFPSTVLQLLKENASHSAASLVEDCMVQLTMQGIMGTLQKREGYPLQSIHMFHAARYSDNLLSTLGGEFSKCFDPEVQINPNYVIPQLYTNPELEQITVLLLLGNQILKSSGLFVGKLLGMLPYSRHQPALPFTQGLELLGMKWTPGLSVSQAKEITPCEVGDRLWKNSLHTLANEPCLALALRGVNAFSKLESVVQPRSFTDTDPTFNLEMIHARTAEEAYTYVRLFFTERELFSDPLARPMLPYMPVYQTKHHDLHSTASSKSISETSTYPVEESIFELMLSGPRPFSTFLVIKPRALTKHLTKILKKLALEGFKIVGLKLQHMTVEQCQRFIPESTEISEREKHVAYMTSGPSLLLCVQRENAVKKLLDLLGPEDPQSARRQSQFYWRGVFGTDTVSNAIYASTTLREAVDDQKHFYPDGLCCEENDISLQEMITCPAEDLEIDMKYSLHRKVKSNTTINTQTSDASHVLLQQTNCVVLTPLLMRKLGAQFGYVDVIDGLIAQGFELVGGRMIWLTQEQARQVLCLVDAGSFQQVPLLVSGPSIVLALQRDNAVLAFDTILRESFSTESSQGKSVTDSLLHKYGKLILRPAEIKQAEKMLGFFFSELLPNSELQIVQQNVET